MMKIGIDARFYDESGVGRYLRNLIANLKILDKENEYFVFLQQKNYQEFTNTKNFQAVCANFKWYGFTEQFNYPKLINKFQLDLVHFPHFNIPIFYRGKFVVTIHDLIHQHYVMDRATTLNPVTYKIKQIGYRKVFKTAITKSEKILVPSKFVEGLLADEWGVSNEKIIVTYEAVDNRLFAIASKMNQNKNNEILKKFNIRLPFLFYVGNAHPHKNVEGLIRAFLKLTDVKGRSLQLVLSGHDHYFWQRIKKQFLNKDIIFTGKISDEELVALYKSALAFVMPSFEEGFGIPILEAMACECPVLASKEGSLSEVGGDAAIYFDPHNGLDMINKINQVLNSEKLRKDLVNKGKVRVKSFSWESLAKKTLEVYLQCE